jgi:hypothetical protein
LLLVFSLVETFGMKRVFTILLFGVSSFANSQTIFQAGFIQTGLPFREPTSGTVELLTVDNTNLVANKAYLSSTNNANSLMYADTIQFAEWLDTLGNFSLTQHQYQYGFVGSGMAIFSGMSHKTNPPFFPISMCAGGLGWADPIYGWLNTEFYGINWQFRPEGTEYDRYDPRYVSYTASQHPWNQGGRITGVFNHFEDTSVQLDVYDIYPEESLPTSLLFSIPLESPFYLNHSVEANRQLLLSGLNIQSSGDFTMTAKATLVDLENESWIEVELENEVNTNSEVISGLVDENGIVFLLIRFSDLEGKSVECRLIKYDGEVTLIKSFAGEFKPLSIVERTYHGVLLGGDYNRFGLKTASLFEIEEHVGLSRMIGYADIKDVATSFQHFEETELGGMIAGTYDSLNGSPKGSFMTPLVRESLLSVGQQENRVDLGILIGQNLRLNETGTLVEVLDVSGRVCSLEMPSTNQLSLHYLNSGIYLLRLRKGNEQQVIKAAFVTH